MSPAIGIQRSVGGHDNEVGSVEATVAGGRANTANPAQASIGGGYSNSASTSQATVDGGSENEASGPNSTIPGGDYNFATGTAAFAAGAGAKASSDNAFVWNDSSAYLDIDNDGTDEGLSSDGDVAGSGVTGAGTVHVSAQGGVRIITGPSAVTYVDGWSAGWSTTSTRSAKTNVDPVDPLEALAGVEELQLATWEYKLEDGEGAGTTHLGPMAEEFHAAFEVGDSDEHINSIDADGVAFAAIQGLSSKLDAKCDRIEDLEAQNDQLRDRLTALEQKVGQLTKAAGGSATPAGD